MLMSGGFLVITQFSTGEMNPFFTAVIVSPGLLLAAITQFFWKRDRQKFDPTGNAIEEETGEERRPSRIRAPRQVRRQRKRGSRPGRSSRHPF
jgi:hypothetical protein